MTTVFLKPVGTSAPTEVRLEQPDRNEPGCFNLHWKIVQPTDQPPQLSARSADSGPSGQIELKTEMWGGATGYLCRHNQIVPFGVNKRNAIVQVWVGGRVYTFELLKNSLRRAAHEALPSGFHDLTAPMPGTILKILAEPGQAFDAHQGLVIIESMKMETTLSAPAPGRVIEVRCQTGQLVEPGAILVKVKTE